MLKAIEVYHNQTCIRFKPRTDESQWISFVHKRGWVNVIQIQALLHIVIYQEHFMSIFSFCGCQKCCARVAHIHVFEAFSSNSIRLSKTAFGIYWSAVGFCVDTISIRHTTTPCPGVDYQLIFRVIPDTHIFVHYLVLKTLVIELKFFNIQSVCVNMSLFTIFYPNLPYLTDCLTQSLIRKLTDFSLAVAGQQ